MDEKRRYAHGLRRSRSGGEGSGMQEKLRLLLVEVCQLPPDFDSAANLYFELGVPSVKAMELLMELEERFEVQVPDDQFVEAVSLEKLTAMMEGLGKASA